MQLTQLRINQQRCGHKSQFDWLLSGGTCIFNLDHTGHKLTRKSHQKIDFLKTSNANEWCLEAEIELL